MRARVAPCLDQGNSMPDVKLNSQPRAFIAFPELTCRRSGFNLTVSFGKPEWRSRRFHPGSMFGYLEMWSLGLGDESAQIHHAASSICDVRQAAFENLIFTEATM